MVVCRLRRTAGARMSCGLLAPSGAVYQAGTLSGNPLAMAAGLATLRELERPGDVRAVSRQRVVRWHEASSARRRRWGLRSVQQRLGGMWGFFLTSTPVTDYATAKTADTARFARLFHALLAEGVYIAPSQFETCFMSTVHDSRRST